MLITQENSLLIFGDSGFSRSGGAENRVKHLSQSSHKGRDIGIKMYLDVFIAIYFYLPLFKNNLINQ